MISSEGEEVPLKNCILRSSELEEIMSLIFESMTSTLKYNVRISFLNYENDEKKDWILK